MENKWKRKEKGQKPHPPRFRPAGPVLPPPSSFPRPNTFPSPFPLTVARFDQVAQLGTEPTHGRRLPSLSLSD